MTAGSTPATSAPRSVASSWSPAARASSFSLRARTSIRTTWRMCSRDMRASSKGRAAVAGVRGRSRDGRRRRSLRHAQRQRSRGVRGNGRRGATRHRRGGGRGVARGGTGAATAEDDERQAAAVRAGRSLPARRFRRARWQSSQRSRRSPGPAADASAVERRLLEICQSLLPARKLAAEDNLFEIGTSSLALAQIYERVDAAWPGLLEVTDFFDYPTVQAMARYLEQQAARVPA